MDIVLQRVSMRFGETVALSDIDVAIEAGEAFSFVGPPGCGKTTILRLIAGLNEPSTGRVSIGGRDMAGIGPSDRPVGLIVHSLPVFPLMRVWENVVFHADSEQLDRRGRRARAERLLGLFDLTGQADRALIELSALDRLRVAVVGALATDPAVLLLDEPLAALPADLAQPLLEDLATLHAKTGLTLIYITADLAAARRFGGRIARMSAGRIERVEAATAAG